MQARFLVPFTVVGAMCISGILPRTDAQLHASEPPVPIELTVHVDFVAQQGTFSASGAVNDSGMVQDRATFLGFAVHIDRTLFGAHGNMFMRIDSTRSSCTIPFLPDCSSTLNIHLARWQFTGGTGDYDGLAGEGSWLSFVTFDPNTGRLAAADEKLSGLALIHAVR